MWREKPSAETLIKIESQVMMPICTLLGLKLSVNFWIYAYRSDDCKVWTRHQQIPKRLPCIEHNLHSSILTAFIKTAFVNMRMPSAVTIRIIVDTPTPNTTECKLSGSTKLDTSPGGGGMAGKSGKSSIRNDAIVSYHGPVQYNPVRLSPGEGTEGPANSQPPDTGCGRIKKKSCCRPIDIS